MTTFEERFAELGLHPAVFGDQRNWWVEVLLDDGAQWGTPVLFATREEAIKEALFEARRHGLKPAGVASITDNDE